MSDLQTPPRGSSGQGHGRTHGRSRGHPGSHAAGHARRGAKPGPEHHGFALGFSVAFIGLIAFATFDPARPAFSAVLLVLVLLAVAYFQLAFAGSRFFVIALANSLGIYASIFALLVQSNFSTVESPAHEIGFALPILSFIAGAWLRRERIRAIIRSETLQQSGRVPAAFMWLLPLAAIGTLTFVLPEITAAPAVLTRFFLGAMTIISIMVFFVSHDVATFLIDTGLLFEEFFENVRELAAAAFAFLTFYSTAVIVFAGLYRLIDRLPRGPHFDLRGSSHAMSFSESLYFSVATMATVGYGDITPVSSVARILAAVQVLVGILLLLFGFSELMTYMRAQRPRRKPADAAAEKAPE